MSKNLIIWPILIVLCTKLYSQGEEQFLPSDQKQLTVVTEPATLYKGFFKTSINYNYSSVKNLFNNEAQKEIIPGASAARSSSLNFIAQYGITDRIELSLWIPYMMNKTDHVFLLDDPTAAESYYTGRVEGFGLGDISMGIRAQVLKEQDRIPSLTLGSYLELPTGRKNPSNETGYMEFDEATGSGEFSLGIDAQVRKIAYPYSMDFTSGFEYKSGGQKIHFPGEVQTPFQSGNVFYAIAGLDFHLNDWICISNDFNYTHIGKYSLDDGLVGDITWAFSWTPNIHFQVKKLRLAQGFIFPIKGRNFGGDPGFILIVQYIF
jgi:hypothetical protein